MPEFGFWELALIMLVALLIVGPRRLPRLAADVGAWIGRVKKIAQRFKADVAYELNASELEKTIGEPRQEIDRIHKEARKAGGQVSDAIRSLDPLRAAMREQIGGSGRYHGDDESLRDALSDKTAGAPHQSRYHDDESPGEATSEPQHLSDGKTPEDNSRAPNDKS